MQAQTDTLSTTPKADSEGDFLARLRNAYGLSQDGEWQEAIAEAEPALHAATATPEQRCVAAALLFHGYAMREEEELSQAAHRQFEQECARAAFPPTHSIHRMMEVFENAHQDRLSTPEQNEAFWAVPAEFLGQMSAPETLDDVCRLFQGMEWCGNYRAYQMTRRYARALLERPAAPESRRCQALLYLFCACAHLGDKEEAREAAEQFAWAIRAVDWEETDPYPSRAYLVRQMRGLQEKFGFGETDAEITPEPAYTPPVGDGFWETAEAASVGLRPDAIDALREYEQLCKASGADAFLVVCRGKIVSEWYAPGYEPPIGVYSCAKSWTSLLTGMLIADGRIGGVDDPVGVYLPEWRDGIRGRVTLRHLLTMTSGLTCIGERSQSVLEAEDDTAFVRGLTPSEEPGTMWSYSNEGVQLLSPILEQAAGMSLRDYARQRLFEPLGMTETGMVADEQGRTCAYGGGYTSLRDFARLGALLLNGGRWQGRQIVPEAWIHAATHSSAVSSDYGYLFWLGDEPAFYSMAGDLENCCYCFPGQELVIVRQQADYSLWGASDYSDKAFPLFQRLAAE